MKVKTTTESDSIPKIQKAMKDISKLVPTHGAFVMHSALVNLTADVCFISGMSRSEMLDVMGKSWDEQQRQRC